MTDVRPSDVVWIEERNRWLAERGLLRLPGERPGAHVARLAEFCRGVGKIGFAPASTDWAKRIVRDHARGVRIHRASLGLARQALKLDVLPEFGSARVDRKREAGPVEQRDHAARSRAVAEVEF